MNLEFLKSGRYLLTLICGAVFAYTACLSILPIEYVQTIITTVFALYFARERSRPTSS